MEIRFAKPEDVPGILCLLRQVAQVHHLGRPDIFRAGGQKYSASQVLSMISDTTTPIFVAAEADRVLGYGICMVQVHTQDSVIADHTSLYIDDLCVDQACRGSGIATQLFHAVHRYALEQGFDTVTLNVWCGNNGAMAFYEKMGMSPRNITMELSL